MGYDDLTLGERLRVARERCGLTKVAVARIVLDPGKDKDPRSATIAAWERETMGITVAKLLRLADLYEKVGSISRRWLVLGDGPMISSNRAVEIRPSQVRFIDVRPSEVREGWVHPGGRPR